MRKFFPLLFLLLSPALLAANPPLANTPLEVTKPHEGSRDDFVTYVKNNLQPIDSIRPDAKCDDLKFLDNLGDGAKIIAVGESRHGSHEIMQLRARIVRCLVIHHGFTNILLEAGLPYASRLNDYVHGARVNAEMLVSGMGYWSLYQTHEFLGLLDWLRKYNADSTHKKKLNLLGIDMQDPRVGTRDTLAYLGRVDPAFIKKLSKVPGNLGLFEHSPSLNRMTEVYRKMTDGEYESLSAKLTMIQQRFDSKKDSYIAKRGKPAYVWAREEFATVMQAHEAFSKVRKGNFRELYDARETALAKNVEWQVHQDGPGERYILLSHNNHIAMSAILTAGRDGKTYEEPTMGMSLARAWSGSYRVIGVSNYENKGEWHVWQNDAEVLLQVARPDSLDAVLASAGDSYFYIDLDGLLSDSPAGKWASRPHVVTSGGGLAALTPLSAFDGILFVRRLSQAKFTSGAIKHLVETGPARPKAIQMDKSLLDKTEGNYRLGANTLVQFKEMDGEMYVLWNHWQFRAYAVNKNQFELRVVPQLSFKFSRAEDGSVTSLAVRQGESPWQKATLVK